MLGTIVAALPPVKAQEPVRVFVKDLADGDNIYPGKPPGGFLPWQVSIFIESPLAWAGTDSGIVAYTISVRVDPSVLQVFGAITVPDRDGDGFTDGFLDLYALAYGWSTLQTPFIADQTTGTIYGFAQQISPYPPPHGAGGNYAAGTEGSMELMAFTFKSYSQTEPSPIDLLGVGAIVAGIDVSFKYTNARGETYNVEPEDGWYVGETPYKVIMGEVADPFDPADPIGSIWHELWPNYSEEWVLESWDENGSPGTPGVLDASDQIDMRNSTGHVVWFHVDWLNTEPVGGDGKADMTATVKPPVPEFPLGLGLMLAIAPAIPIVYLWRTRKKVGTK